MRSALLIVCSFCLVVLRAAPVSAAPLDQAAAAQRVLDLTNTERRNVGLGALRLSPQLNDAAQSYSQVLAGSDCFAHTCGPVPDFAVRFQNAGYVGWSAIAENIAAGYPTPEAVVAGWMGSAGHRQNILTPNFTEMGLGISGGAGRYGTYWAQEFGARAADVSGAGESSDVPADDGAPAPESDVGSGG